MSADVINAETGIVPDLLVLGYSTVLEAEKSGSGEGATKGEWGFTEFQRITQSMCSCRDALRQIEEQGAARCSIKRNR